MKELDKLLVEINKTSAAFQHCRLADHDGRTFDPVTCMKSPCPCMMGIFQLRYELDRYLGPALSFFINPPEDGPPQDHVRLDKRQRQLLWHSVMKASRLLKDHYWEEEEGNEKAVDGNSA